jgi:hypothetical protein
VGLAEGWTVFGILLGVGGLAFGVLGAVPAGLVLLGFGPASHGGFATVEVVPLDDDPFGCDMLPDAAVVLAPTPLLALEPVLPVVDVVLPGEVEVVLVPEAVVLLGVHGATVGVVPLGLWVALVPVVPPVTAPGLPATPGVPCVGAGAPIELVPDCEAGVPVLGCVVVAVPG